MKIYTKTGDTGTTSLIGGKRVPKYHDRIVAYGTVDELISYVGLIRDLINENKLKENLLFIQDRLMTCASIIATDCEGCNIILPVLNEKDVEFLEKEIDKMESQLEPLKSFVLPGGNIASSYVHIARTICRRSERNTLLLNKEHKVESIVIRFLNRLSDFLFVFARYILKQNGGTETNWTPLY